MIYKLSNKIKFIKKFEVFFLEKFEEYFRVRYKHHILYSSKSESKSKNYLKNILPIIPFEYPYKKVLFMKNKILIFMTNLDYLVIVYNTKNKIEIDSRKININQTPFLNKGSKVLLKFKL